MFKQLRFSLVWSVAFVVLAALATSARAADTIDVNYNLVDNGGCPKLQHTVAIQYRSEQPKRDARGFVQTNPAGGDCTQTALSFDFYVAQYWAAFGDWDLAFSGGANRTSVGAPYGLLDEAGMFILRSDGAAAFQTNLPAGQAENISGSIRISRDLFIMDGNVKVRAGAGVDVVPVDWADGTSGRSGKFVLGIDYGEHWDFDLNLNVGHGTFGDAVLRYHREFEGSNIGFNAEFEVDFGLNELDPGVPAMQDVQGSQFGLLGAPEGKAIALRIGFTFGL